ncbi:helix-turn-helix domain-containing protein [Jatrophihabitans sp.]|uniref:helix-turn-helix domain-containing protein n=1 Tax=Jatrophihabitans sp. TaxID=1932789 RepID=UPI0030C70525
MKILLTPADAADALSVGRSTVYNLMRAGVLPSVKIGKSRRISAEALLDYVGSLSGPQVAEQVLVEA